MGSGISSPTTGSDRIIVAGPDPASPVKQQRRSLRRHSANAFLDATAAARDEAVVELTPVESISPARGDILVDPPSLHTSAELWAAEADLDAGAPCAIQEADEPASPSASDSSPIASSLDDDDAAVYAGELINLNDGVLGYDSATMLAAAAGNASAQRAVYAADHALATFRREAPLVVTPDHLEELAPEVRQPQPQPPRARDGKDAPSDDDTTCHVCQESIEPGELKRRLPCGHEFHSACVGEWLTRNVGSCPLCRAALQPSLSEIEVQAWRSAYEDAQALAAAEIAMRLNPIEEDSERSSGAHEAGSGAHEAGSGAHEAGSGALASSVPPLANALDSEEVARQARAMAAAAAGGFVSPVQATLYNHHLARACSSCRLQLPYDLRALHLDAVNQAWLTHRAGVGRAQMGVRRQ